MNTTQQTIPIKLFSNFLSVSKDVAYNPNDTVASFKKSVVEVFQASLQTESTGEEKEEKTNDPVRDDQIDLLCDGNILKDDCLISGIAQNKTLHLSLKKDFLRQGTLGGGYYIKLMTFNEDEGEGEKELNENAKTYAKDEEVPILVRYKDGSFKLCYNKDDQWILSNVLSEKEFLESVSPSFKSKLNDLENYEKKRGPIRIDSQKDLDAIRNAGDKTNPPLPVVDKILGIPLKKETGYLVWSDTTFYYADKKTLTNNNMKACPYSRSNSAHFVKLSDLPDEIIQLLPIASGSGPTKNLKRFLNPSQRKTFEEKVKTGSYPNPTAKKITYSETIMQFIYYTLASDDQKNMLCALELKLALALNFLDNLCNYLLYCLSLQHVYLANNLISPLGKLNHFYYHIMSYPEREDVKYMVQYFVEHSTQPAFRLRPPYFYDTKTLQCYCKNNPHGERLRETIKTIYQDESNDFTLTDFLAYDSSQSSQQQNIGFIIVQEIYKAIVNNQELAHFIKYVKNGSISKTAIDRLDGASIKILDNYCKHLDDRQTKGFLYDKERLKKVFKLIAMTSDIILNTKTLQLFDDYCAELNAQNPADFNKNDYHLINVDLLYNIFKLYPDDISGSMEPRQEPKFKHVYKKATSFLLHCRYKEKSQVPKVGTQVTYKASSEIVFYFYKLARKKDETEWTRAIEFFSLFRRDPKADILNFNYDQALLDSIAKGEIDLKIIRYIHCKKDHQLSEMWNLMSNKADFMDFYNQQKLEFDQLIKEINETKENQDAFKIKLTEAPKEILPYFLEQAIENNREDISDFLLNDQLILTNLLELMLDSKKNLFSYYIKLIKKHLYDIDVVEQVFTEPTLSTSKRIRLIERLIEDYGYQLNQNQYMTLINSIDSRQSNTVSEEVILLKTITEENLKLLKNLDQKDEKEAELEEEEKKDKSNNNEVFSIIQGCKQAIKVCAQQKKLIIKVHRLCLQLQQLILKDGKDQSRLKAAYEFTLTKLKKLDQITTRSNSRTLDTGVEDESAYHIITKKSTASIVGTVLLSCTGIGLIAGVIQWLVTKDRFLFLIKTDSHKKADEIISNIAAIETQLKKENDSTECIEPHNKNESILSGR